MYSHQQKPVLIALSGNFRRNQELFENLYPFPPQGLTSIKYSCAPLVVSLWAAGGAFPNESNM